MVKSQRDVYIKALKEIMQGLTGVYPSDSAFTKTIRSVVEKHAEDQTSPHLHGRLVNFTNRLLRASHISEIQSVFTLMESEC